MKALKKPLSIVLSILIIIGTMSSAFAAVQYPNRDPMEDDYVRETTFTTDAQKLNNVVNIIDTILLGNDFAQVIGSEVTLDALLENLISENLYSDAIITEIVKLIYPTVWRFLMDTIEQNGNIDTGVMGIHIELRWKMYEICWNMIDNYGLYIYPADLANKALANIDSEAYAPAINEFRNAHDNWDNVNWDNVSWGVHDKDSWIKAMGAALSGAVPLIQTILANRYYDHREELLDLGVGRGRLGIKIQPVAGYNNVIVPLLEMLLDDTPVSYTYKGHTYTGILPTSQYESLTDINDLIAHIMYPIFGWIEHTMSTTPVKTVAEVLANLALNIKNNCLYNWLNSLNTDININVDGDVVGIHCEFFDTTMNVNLRQMLIDDGPFAGVDTRSLDAIINCIMELSGTELRVPAIDTNLLSTLGHNVERTSASRAGTRSYLEGDSGAVLLSLLRYVCRAMGDETFRTQLFNLLNQPDLLNNPMLAQVIQNIGEDPDGVVCALVELCNPGQYDYKEIFNRDYVYTRLAYSEYWTEDDAYIVGGNMESFVNNAMKLLGVEKTLGEIIRGLIGENLYTNANVTTIAKLLNSFAASMGTGADRLLDVFHLNISQWREEVPDDKNWGFTDGDENGFLEAVAELFTPVNILLKLILADVDYYAFDDQIKVEGYAGYNYGIIPILEAIGCKRDDIVTGQQYLLDMNEDESNIIKNIIKPIFGLLERVYANPVNTLLDILPNIVYFVDSGALSSSIKNALYAVFVLADLARPAFNTQDVLDFDLDFDIQRLIDQVLNLLSLSGDIDIQGFKVPISRINFQNLIANRLQTGISKNGITRYYVDGNSNNTITALLKTVVDIIFYDENVEQIKELVKNAEAITPKLNAIIATTLDSFAELQGEELGTDKILGIFYYIFNVAERFLDGDMEYIADLINRWDYVDRTIATAKNGYIQSFIEELADKLRDLRTISEQAASTKELEFWLDMPTGDMEMYSPENAQYFAQLRAEAFEITRAVNTSQSEVNNKTAIFKNALYNLAPLNGLDYSGIYDAIVAAGRVNSAQYSNFGTVTEAINAVEIKNEQTQGDVDAQAQAILDAIDGLTYCCTELADALDVLIDEYDNTGAVNSSNYKLIGQLCTDVYNLKISGCKEVHPYLSNRYTRYESILAQYRAHLYTKGMDTFTPATVTYPVRQPMENDYFHTEPYATDKAAFETVVNKIDAVVAGDDFATLVGLEDNLQSFAENLLNEKIYSDGIINTLLKSIYPAVWELIVNTINQYGAFEVFGKTLDLKTAINKIAETILVKYGICLYPDDLGNKLASIDSRAFSEISKALKAAGKDWNRVNWEKMKWNVRDKDTFVKALGAVLSGAEPLLLAILAGQDYQKNETVFSAFNSINANLLLKAEGISGYGSVLVPFLEIILGDSIDYTYKGVHYTSLLSVAEYEQIDNITDAVAHLIYPIVSFVENKLTVAPLRTIAEIIPQLVLFLKYDLLTEMVKSLGTKVSFGVDVDVYGSVIDMDFDFNAFDMLNDEAFGGILIGADLTSIDGIANFVLELTGSELRIPALDSDTVSGLGTLERVRSASTTGYTYKLKVNAGDSLLEILKYAVGCLENEEFVDTLLATINQSQLKENEIVAQILTKLRENPDEIIAAVVELCVPVKYDYREVFAGEYEITATQYSDYWTKEDATVVSQSLDGLVETICSLAGIDNIGDMLRDLIGENLYTNATVTAIATALGGVINMLGERADDYLGVLGINADVWKNVTADKRWGFADGDKNGFLAALTRVLSPLNPLLKTVLANQDFTVLDGQVTLKGYEGYKHGVIPILEALMCDGDTIVTGEQYIADAAEDEANLIKHIINPIFALLDRVYAEPIKTVISILPNLLYFVDRRAASNAIMNLAQAVLTVLDTIRPVYDLNFSLDYNLDDLANLINGLLEDSDISFRIPETSFLSNAIKGEAVQAVSKSGDERYYVNPENADIVTALLRIVAEFAFSGDNGNEILNLVTANAALPREVVDLITAAIDALTTLNGTEDGTDKILGFIFYVYNAGIDFLNGDGRVVQGIIDRWDYVAGTISPMEERYQYIVGFLQDFARKAKELRAIRESEVPYADLDTVRGLPFGQSEVYSSTEELDAALAQVNSVIENADRTQADVQAAAEVLKSALLGLTSVAGADYAPVYEKLFEIEELDKEQYTNFDVVKDAIKALKFKATDTQTEVAEMISSLDGAIAQLEYCCKGLEFVLDTLISEYEETNTVNDTNSYSIAELLDIVHQEELKSCNDIHPYLADKYASYEAILAEYNEHLATKGKDGFVPSTIRYPVRIYSQQDLVHNENYETNKASFETVVNKIDTILKGNDFAKLLGLDTTLDGFLLNLISENLYKDETITSIVKLIYPSICDLISNALSGISTVNVLDKELHLQGLIDQVADKLLTKYDLRIYPYDLAEKLTAYPETAAEFRNAGSNWSNVNWDNVKWNANDKEGFVTALGNSLVGAEPLVLTLLCGKDYSEIQTVFTAFEEIGIDVKLFASGVNGYNNILLPLLELLTGGEADYTYKGTHYTTLYPSESYKDITNVADAVAHFALPLLSMVENRFANKPFKTLSELLPELALFIEYKGIEQMLKSLETTARIEIDVNAYGKVLDMGIDANVYDLLMSDLTGGLLLGADFGSINGIASFILEKAGIELPLPIIDTGYLGHMGTLKEISGGSYSGKQYRVEANSGDVLLYLLRYISFMLNDKEFVDSLLGLVNMREAIYGNEFVVNLINKFTAEPDKLICAVVELCCPKTYDMTTLFDTDKISKNPITGVRFNTQQWTYSKAQRVANDLDTFANTLLAMFGQSASLGSIIQDLIGTNLYTNKNLTTVVVLLKDLLASLGEGGNKILEVAKIDLSSWEGIDENTNLGFADGDAQGFVNTAIDLLSPFNSLLKLVLSGEDFTILDGQIVAKGYEGYTYGVLPILEALGCADSDIVSPEAYMQNIATDEDAILRDILTPILKLLEKFYEAPIDTALEILPNVLYFIKTEALDNALKNTMQAILSVIDTIRPVYSVPLDFHFEIEATVNELLNNLLSENLGIKLPASFSIMNLINGTVTTKTSKNGETRFLVVSDKPKVVTQLLRDVVSVLFEKENYSTIKRTVLDAANVEGALGDLIKAAMDGLEKIYNGPEGCDKILGILYEAYCGVNAVYGKQVGPEMITELWNIAFRVLLSSGEAYILSFVASLKDQISNALKEALGLQDPTPPTPPTPDTPVKCDHLCHKGGFMGFIFKIVNLFNKLFGINKYCECGAAHY